MSSTSPSSINSPKGNINTVDVRRRVVSTPSERDIDIFSTRETCIEVIRLQVVRLFIEYLWSPTQGWGGGVEEHSHPCSFIRFIRLCDATEGFKQSDRLGIKVADEV